MSSDTPSSAAPIEPSVRIGGGNAIRITSDGTGGHVVENIGQQSARLTSTPTSEATGRNSIGQPVERALWSEDTVVSSPLIGGDGRIRELLASGLVTRTAAGYAIAGETVAAGQPVAEGASQPEGQQQEQQPQADPDAVLDEALAKTLPGTSEATDKGMTLLAESTSPVFMDSAVLTAARGGDLTTFVADAASRSGQEPAAVQAVVDAKIAEGTRAAVAACERVGIPADQFEAFSDQLSDEGRDEVVSGLYANNVTALLREARAFVKAGKVSSGYSNAELLSAEYSHGVTAREVNGRVVLDGVPGHGTLTVAEAIKAGVLPVRKR